MEQTPPPPFFFLFYYLQEVVLYYFNVCAGIYVPRELGTVENRGTGRF